MTSLIPTLRRVCLLGICCVLLFGYDIFLGGNTAFAVQCFSIGSMQNTSIFVNYAELLTSQQTTLRMTISFYPEASCDAIGAPQYSEGNSSLVSPVGNYFGSTYSGGSVPSLETDIHDFDISGLDNGTYNVTFKAVGNYGPSDTKTGSFTIDNRPTSKTNTCPAKSGGNTTVWNSVSSFTQTCTAFNGPTCTSWSPADDNTTDYNTNGSSTSCRYKCASGYVRSGGACVLPAACGDGSNNQPSEECDDGDTQNGDGCSSTCQWENKTNTCPAKPGGSSTVWNTVSSFSQTCAASNGSQCTNWNPDNDTTTSYFVTGSTTQCRYKCASAYTWNGSSCVEIISGQCSSTRAKSHPYNQSTWDGGSTYCSAGNPTWNATFPNQGQSVSWKCNGLNGGSQSGNCTASVAIPPFPVDGACGSAHRTIIAPETDWAPGDVFCSAGTASPTSPAFPANGTDVTWTCLGLNSGTNASCQADHEPACTFTLTAIADPSTAQINENIAFSGNVTNAANCVGSKTYEWDWENNGASYDLGPISTTNNSFTNQHSYSALGSKTPRLRVSWYGTTKTAPLTPSVNINIVENGACGSRATDYPSGATGWGGGSFCDKGTAPSPDPTFPSQGNSVNWTCAGIGASATDASCTATVAGANEAICVDTSTSIPTTMLVGQSYPVTVTMQNDGSNNWTAAANYKLGSQNPADNTTWGLNRVNLSGGDNITKPNNKVFSFNVTAPAIPGNYTMQWQMVEEGVEWFGEMCPGGAGVDIQVSGTPWFGNIHNSAYGQDMGWVMFGDPDGTSYAGVYQGVSIATIADENNHYPLSGNAYSSSLGLLDFSGTYGTLDGDWGILNGDASFLSTGSTLTLSNGTPPCESYKTSFDPPSASNYGVCIERGSGFMYGYAWSSTYGWLSFSDNIVLLGTIGNSPVFDDTNIDSNATYQTTTFWIPNISITLTASSDIFTADDSIDGIELGTSNMSLGNCSLLDAEIHRIVDGTVYTDFGTTYTEVQPIAHYRLDDGTGITASDSGPNLLQGSISGAGWTSGRYGNGLDFDGTGDYATVSANPDLNITNYTVAVWIKPNGNGAPTEWAGIVGKPGRNFNIWLHSDGFIHHRFHNSTSTNDGAPNTPIGSITGDQWNHVVITNDGTTAKTYINGIEQANGSAGGAPISDNTALNIGRNLDGASSVYFNGVIDDIRIYDRALTTSEIGTVMQNGTLTSGMSGYLDSVPLSKGSDYTLSCSADGKTIHLNMMGSISKTPGLYWLTGRLYDKDIQSTINNIRLPGIIAGDPIVYQITSGDPCWSGCDGTNSKAEIDANVTDWGDSVLTNGDFSSSEAYTPGWDTALNGTTRGSGGWNGGYNAGAASPSIGYFSHITTGTECTGGSGGCLEFIDENGTYGLTHRWMGDWQTIATDLGASGFVQGEKLKVSLDVKVTDVNKPVKFGIHHEEGGTPSWGTESEGMGLIEKYVSIADQWQTIEHVFTLNSNVDMDSFARFYIYGHYGTVEARFYVDNASVQREVSAVTANAYPVADLTDSYDFNVELYDQYGNATSFSEPLWFSSHVQNAGMEAGSGTDASDWAVIDSASLSEEWTSAEAHSGTYSVKSTVTGTTPGDCYASENHPHCHGLRQTITLTNSALGRDFFASAWVKAPVGIDVRLSAHSNPWGNAHAISNVVTGTGEWMYLETPVLTPVSGADDTIQIRLATYSNILNTDVYWDDVTLLENNAFDGEISLQFDDRISLVQILGEPGAGTLGDATRYQDVTNTDIPTSLIVNPASGTSLKTVSTLDVPSNQMGFRIFSMAPTNYGDGGNTEDNRLWVDDFSFSRRLSPVHTDLLMSLPLDETSGSVANDESANANDGTVNDGGDGGAVWGEAKHSNGLSFDGNNDWINIGSLGDPNEATLMMWFKKLNTNSGTQFLVDGRDGVTSGAAWWLIQDHSPATGVCSTDIASGGDASNADGNLCFRSTLRILPSELQNDTWYHVAVTTSDTGGSKLYLNGELKDSDETDTLNINLANVRLGTSYQNASYFDGTLDDVKIYDRALSPAAIKTAMNVTQRFDDTALPASGKPIFSGTANLFGSENSLQFAPMIRATPTFATSYPEEETGFFDITLEKASTTEVTNVSWLQELNTQDVDGNQHPTRLINFENFYPTSLTPPFSATPLNLFELAKVAGTTLFGSMRSGSIHDALSTLLDANETFTMQFVPEVIGSWEPSHKLKYLAYITYEINGITAKYEMASKDPDFCAAPPLNAPGCPLPPHECDGLTNQQCCDLGYPELCVDPGGVGILYFSVSGATHGEGVEPDAIDNTEAVSFDSGYLPYSAMQEGIRRSVAEITRAYDADANEPQNPFISGKITADESVDTTTHLISGIDSDMIFANIDELFTPSSGNPQTNAKGVGRLLEENKVLWITSGTQNKGFTLIIDGDSVLSSNSEESPRTLIVEGGNVYLKNNITGAGNLGIIILKNRSSGVGTSIFQQYGNLLISPNPTNIKAAAFVEGSLLTMDDTLGIYDGIQNQVAWDNALIHQLYFLGAFSSQNTAGGVTQVKNLASAPSTLVGLPNYEHLLMPSTTSFDQYSTYISNYIASGDETALKVATRFDLQKIRKFERLLVLEDDINGDGIIDGMESEDCELVNCVPNPNGPKIWMTADTASKEARRFDGQDWSSVASYDDNGSFSGNNDLAETQFLSAVILEYDPGLLDDLPIGFLIPIEATSTSQSTR